MFKIITNLNANKKINENFNIFRIKHLIVEFRKIDAIKYTQMITKSTVKKPTRYKISKIICLTKLIEYY